MATPTPTFHLEHFSSFVTDCLVVDKNSAISFDDLFQSYRNWVFQKQVKPIFVSRFQLWKAFKEQKYTQTYLMVHVLCGYRLSKEEKELPLFICVFDEFIAKYFVSIPGAKTRIDDLKRYFLRWLIHHNYESIYLEYKEDGTTKMLKQELLKHGFTVTSRNILLDHGINPNKLGKEK